MAFIVFCNADEEGNITEAICGNNIVPDKQYDYFFYLDEPIDLMLYEISDDELIKKNEGAE